jgi:archaellum component FlaC
METSDNTSKVTTAATTTSAPERLSDDLKNFHNMIDLLSSGIHTFNDELIRLNSESLEQSQSTEMTDKLLSEIKTSIEELNNLLTAVNTNVTLLQQELSLLKQQYDDHQIASYNGTLIWKISGFQEKMSKNI